MMKNLIVRLPDDLAETLRLTAHEINRQFNGRWTEETLAASFLKHVLEDDQASYSRLQIMN